MMVHHMDVGPCDSIGTCLNMSTTYGTSSNLTWDTSTYIVSQEALLEFIKDPMAENRPKVDVLNTAIDEDDIEESEEYETGKIEHRKAASLEAFL